MGTFILKAKGTFQKAIRCCSRHPNVGQYGSPMQCLGIESARPRMVRVRPAPGALGRGRGAWKEQCCSDWLPNFGRIFPPDTTGGTATFADQLEW